MSTLSGSSNVWYCSVGKNMKSCVGGYLADNFHKQQILLWWKWKQNHSPIFHQKSFPCFEHHLHHHGDSPHHHGDSYLARRSIKNSFVSLHLHRCKEISFGIEGLMPQWLFVTEKLWSLFVWGICVIACRSPASAAALKQRDSLWSGLPRWLLVRA